MAPHSLSLSPIRTRPTSPYTTAPSSPKLLGYLSDSDSDFELLDSVSSFVPFNWEEKPGKPKTDIPFEFRVDRLHNSLAAEDLFDGGKIKPLKPPPRLQLDSVAPISGRKSLSPSAGKMTVVMDPFEAAIQSARNEERVCEIEMDETTSFVGSSRFKRLRNLLLFRRFSDGSGSKGNNNNDGLWLTGGSGSGSSTTSGSGNEPEIGYDEVVGGRSLPLCRPNFFRCFMHTI